MSEWISVKEESPRQWEIVLAYSESRESIFTARAKDFCRSSVTHWMSLPEAPKPEKPFYIKEDGDGFYNIVADERDGSRIIVFDSIPATKERIAVGLRDRLNECIKFWLERQDDA